MRRITFMICLVMLTISCRQKEAAGQSKPDIKDHPFSAPAICSNNLMPIDNSKLVGDLLTRWNTSYREHCCEPYLSTPETEMRGKSYFNLDYLSNNDVRAAWIRDFKEVIWYEESKYYVENQHRIKSANLLEAINGVPETSYKSCSLNDIKGKVPTYATDRYDNYVTFNTATGVAVPTRSASYSRPAYSIQNIKAIVAIQQLGPNPKFDFAEVIINNTPRPFFRVQNEKGYLYYDFSDNPTKK
ncbi:hypothetical protein [Flavobacterium sp.]|uniref:hypothetical protein n=1 Tax=Flavobacterium sp. TaxID=239 RepID=UPI00262D9B8F|nr:hypothetical protein [Flavobacterium sp.]